MKHLREYVIHEVTYKYEDENEEEFHKKHMISAGFSVVHTPRFFDIPLTVTYQKRQLNDKVARL